MLSDMIDDLVRADCPQEKEAAYRQLSMFDAGMDLRNERPLPPEVPDKYMVPTGKYPDRLNGKWDGLIFDPTI